MLSGLRDEVVPPEHMQELWEIITRRQGSKVQTNGEPKVNSSEVGRGKSKFVKFPNGLHSMSLSYPSLCPDLSLFADDTCVQHGYWTEVAEFMTSLSRP